MSLLLGVMIQFNKTSFQTVKSKFQLKKPWDILIIFFLSIFITIPLFIVLHHSLIELNWPIYTDRILLFIVVFGILFFAFYKLKEIIIVCLIVFFFVIVYGTLFSNFSFNSVFEDYSSMLYSMNNNPFPQDIISNKLLPFPNKYDIISAVEYKNPKVRNFSIMATTKHFKQVKDYGEYRNLIQCFAVFKEINKRWNYVNDPKNGDYIAKAHESLLYFSGDCDDHSILMAASIKSIGGTPRLIHTKGHIYPEILIGYKKDLEKINYLIRKVLFVTESHNQSLHYHVDDRNQVWLNLDYTAKYPGGPFLSKEILGTLTFD